MKSQSVKTTFHCIHKHQNSEGGPNPSVERQCKDEEAPEAFTIC